MPPQHPTVANDDDESGGHTRRHRRPPNLLSDLLSHNAYFDSVVNMIPARLYVAGAASSASSSSSSSGGGGGPSDNARYRKGQHAESKEARRARDKRAKFDPETAETTLETKRRMKAEAEGDDDDDDDENDDENDDDDDDDDDEAINMSDGEGETGDGEDAAANDATPAPGGGGGGGGIEGDTSPYPSRIEALRAKLRARVAALGGGTKSAAAPDGGDGAAANDASAAAVSKRAARRAEKRRRQEAARSRAGKTGAPSAVDGAVSGGGDNKRRRIGENGSGDVDRSRASSGAVGRMPAPPPAATVAGDLATIDYQSLAGLRPKLDGALDNKSLLGLGMTTGGGKNGGSNGGKKRSLEKLLADAERKQARLRELKSSGEEGDAEKARDIEWGETLKVAGGANLRKTNDPALLKKAIKRKAKKKSSSAKAWNSRVEKVKDSVAERQRIRGHNLDQRKLGGATAANLSSKRIVEKDAGEGGGGGGKGEKRKRMGPHSNQGGNRAGFEGKKSGFINGDGGGGGGGEGRGGGASSAAPGGAGKKGR